MRYLYFARPRGDQVRSCMRASSSNDRDVWLHPDLSAERRSQFLMIMGPDTTPYRARSRTSSAQQGSGRARREEPLPYPCWQVGSVVGSLSSVYPYTLFLDTSRTSHGRLPGSIYHCASFEPVLRAKLIAFRRTTRYSLRLPGAVWA